MRRTTWEAATQAMSDKKGPRGIRVASALYSLRSHEEAQGMCVTLTSTTPTHWSHTHTHTLEWDSGLHPLEEEYV